MEAMQDIGTLVVRTLGSMYLLVVMLRFILQLAKADFYNPISQFAVKATNPLLIPIRRVIPGLMGIDLASLFLAVIVQYAILQACLLMLGHGIINPVMMGIWSIIGVLALTASVYFWGLIIMIVASWIAPQSNNPALMLINQLIAPITEPIRRLLPDMDGIDISPIFAFLIIQVAEIIIENLATATGMVNHVKSLVVGL